jgi:hypothetical protein
MMVVVNTVRMPLGFVVSPVATAKTYSRSFQVIEVSVSICYSGWSIGSTKCNWEDQIWRTKRSMATGRLMMLTRELSHASAMSHSPRSVRLFKLSSWHPRQLIDALPYPWTYNLGTSDGPPYVDSRIQGSVDKGRPRAP